MTFAFRLVDGLPERWSLSANVQSSLKWLNHFDLRSTHCIIAKSLLNLPDCFHFGISKLLIKLDAVSLLHVFSPIGRNAMQQAHITAPHTLAA
jgi:hypothetical protein